MTPDALHAWVVAQWQRMLDTARAATPGPWLADPTGTVCAEADLVDDMLQPIGHGPQEIAECYRSERPTERADNAAHIAVFDPTFATAVCEAALDRLSRHAPVLDSAGAGFCGYCIRHLGNEEYAERPWPCPDALSDAAPFRHLPDFPEELNR